MKRLFFIYILLFGSILTLTSCKNDNKANNTNNISVNRTSTSISNTNINDTQNPVENTQNNNLDGSASNGTPNTNNEQNSPPQSQENNASSAETVVSEFSTQIKTKSKDRATNIGLTCNKINEVVVKPGQEFSFCATIGTSKASDGYKKADVIIGKKIVQALGGGNCQVSTTLYNAVLNVSELQVTERHPHGKKVNYVPEGKDAAIAHGSKDFKFKNNSDKDLKIYASSDGKSVNMKLVFVN